MSTDDFEGSFDTDEELRALLRGGDPARALSPADPAGLESLLEDIMSADLDIRPAEPGELPRRRTRTTWLVAAAAVAAIAAGGAFAVNGLTADGPDAPQADHRPTTTVSDPNAPLAGQTTSLSVAQQQGRCAPASPELLAQYDQAFEGTVTSIEGDTVTLQATDVFQGEVGETVQVTAPPSGMDRLLGDVKFQVGGTYLVSAYQGSVSLCGYSGPATGDLQSLFEKAFVH